MLKEYFSIMTPLQYFFVISGVIITIIALSIARRERFNALHFVVFIAWGVGLLVFWFFPQVLDHLAIFAWVARWADVLVYGWVVFLFYFSLLLLQRIEALREEITRLVRVIALMDDHEKK